MALDEEGLDAMMERLAEVLPGDAAQAETAGGIDQPGSSCDAIGGAGPYAKPPQRLQASASFMESSASSAFNRSSAPTVLADDDFSRSSGAFLKSSGSTGTACGSSLRGSSSNTIGGGGGSSSSCSCSSCSSCSSSSSGGGGSCSSRAVGQVSGGHDSSSPS